MRILHYIPTYAPAWSFGGPVLSVSQLCQALAELGHEVTVLTSNAGLENDPAIPLGKAVILEGVSVTYFKRQPGMGIHCPDLERAIAGHASNSDIIHVTGVWQRVSPAARKAALGAGVPFVVSPRGALGAYSWTQKRLKKLMYYYLSERANMHAASGIHYTSSMERDECARFAFPGLAAIIANGVDTRIWRPDELAAARWRASIGAGADDFLMLCAGRLHHKKGLDLLPEALALAAGSNFRLIFVGGDDDGTKDLLVRDFAARGLSERVKFLDRVAPAELAGIYSGADCFVLPSRHENFGNSVLEAMACGCTALVSDQVGFASEAGGLGQARILPRDPGAWAEAMAQAARSPLDAKARLALAGRVGEAYDITRTASDMAAFYRDIIAARRQRT